MSTELTPRTTELMPAFSIQGAIDRYNQVVEFTQKIMKDGKDYGTIPGTGKATLLKPGAEKLCSFFGLAVDYTPMREVEDWGAGFFYFSYKAVLSRGGEVVATGIGSCNSKEKKYRWRNAERKCPKCGKETIRKSKDDGGFYCWRKLDGCGATFTADDPAITQQTSGKVENTEPFDLVNTIQKMAQKRALVAATLIAANASEFYTQDIEDIEFVEGEVIPPKAEEKPKPRSMDRVNELKRLVAVTEFPAKITAKWLDAAKVRTLDELTDDQVEKCIKRVFDYAKKKQAEETFTKPDAFAEYVLWVEHLESIAQDCKTAPTILSNGLANAMEKAGLKGKEHESDAKLRKQIEKAVRDNGGYFADPNRKDEQ